MLNYETYMQRCLQLAEQGRYRVAPNPMVGAVIVAEGRIIGEGYHMEWGGKHAEVHAFASVKREDEHLLPKATLFVSLEPCSHYGKTPPCADLVISKGVRRVVVGMPDPNPVVAGNGVRKLQEAGIEVVTGVLEKDCRELNKRFLCLHEKHRPYVILKWAQTADGYIDRKRRDSSEPVLVISNALTKQAVHKMRAENMAIMVGTNTVLLDNPRLLTTHWSGRNPVRIVPDRHGRIAADARIFSHEAETIVYRGQTDWQYILSDLAERQIHSVLVEGGAQLLRHILDSGVYDEVHVEVSPLRIGEGVAAPKVVLPSVPADEVEGNLLYSFRCG